MANPLIWLSGAQPKILAECPTERPKYVGIGSAILITSTVAAVSMTFALYTALKTPLGLAVPMAVAWGFAIMSLDRWLVVSLVRDEKKWNYLRLAIPRLLLALLFGAIISTPVVLMVFRSEIAAEIPLIQQANAANGYHQANTNAIQRTIVLDHQRVNTLRYQAAGGSLASYDPNSDHTLKEAKKTRNHDGAQASLAKQTGSGDYHYWQNKWQQDQQIVISRRKLLISRNQQAEQAMIKQANKDLPAALDRLASDENKQTQFISQLNQASSADTGILIRLQALDTLAQKNSTVWWAKLILFLFFTAIECLPIFVKVLLNLGPANRYEEALANEEELQASLAAHRRALRKRKGLRESEGLGRDADRLAEALYASTPDIDEEATRAASRISRARLRDWEAREMQDIADRRAKPGPVSTRLRPMKPMLMPTGPVPRSTGPARSMSTVPRQVYSAPGPGLLSRIRQWWTQFAEWIGLRL